MDIQQLLALCTLFVLLLLPTTRCGNSGFYVDTDDKTVLLDKLSRRQQKVIKEEMLNILGLEREPKLKRNKVKSAPDYMLELYRQFAFQDENEATDAYVKQGVSRENEADLVISFVNHGRSLFSPIFFSTDFHSNLHYYLSLGFLMSCATNAIGLPGYQFNKSVDYTFKCFFKPLL